MPINPGFFSNAIIGEQPSDFDTCMDNADVIQKVWEFRSTSIRNRGPKATPARFKGNRSPSGLIEGFYHAEGDVVLDAHADDLGVWIKQALHTVTPDSDPYHAHGETVLPAVVWAASGTKKSLTTQPTATTPAMDPGIFTITFRATGGAPKNYTGNVVIEGTDQNDIEITQIVPFVGASVGVTTFYFKTVDASGVTINCTPLLADDTIDILCYKNVNTHIFALGDSILPGMTMELLKGTIPSVAVGMIVNTMRMDIGDVLGLTFGMLGKRLWNRYKLPTHPDTAPVPSVTGTSQAGFPHPGELVFPAWGLALYIDASGTATPIASGSFSTSNGLRTPRRYRGLRTEPQPIAGDLRESVLTVGLDYDTVNADFDAKALANGEVDIDLIAVCSPYAGPEYSLTISMPRCQIPDFPDPEVNNFGEVLQEITFRSIRTAAATTSDELVITLQNTKAAYNTV